MYQCQYCGRNLYTEGTFVEVCQCPEAVREEQALKERMKMLACQNQLTFDEARKKNKRSSREK